MFLGFDSTSLRRNFSKKKRSKPVIQIKIANSIRDHYPAAATPNTKNHNN